MSDGYINIPLDEERLSRLSAAGLGSYVQEMDGTQSIQVGITRKEQKKLLKGFCDLAFDESNSCVLPDEATDTLLDVIVELQTLDVMKVAIFKLYNPLAGRDVFGRGTGCR